MGKKLKHDYVYMYRMYTALCSPVLFSVGVTTAVVTAGEAVTVNCSQTGYIRTQWSWRRNGADITSDKSQRVYIQPTTRTKLGPRIPTVTVPNHQTLSLHLRYARVMDNGVYTCATETDIRTVTVDVQPPGGMSNIANYNTSFHVLYIRCLYSMHVL